MRDLCRADLCKSLLARKYPQFLARSVMAEFGRDGLGPYDTPYGQGHTAEFKLMVDNNSGSDVVASLDVVTGFGGNILATRQVRRSDPVSHQEPL